MEDKFYFSSFTLSNSKNGSRIKVKTLLIMLWINISQMEWLLKKNFKIFVLSRLLKMWILKIYLIFWILLEMEM